MEACDVSTDFGSHVSVFRADGQPTNPEDERRIRSAARSLQFTRPDRIGPFDHFDLRFGGAHRLEGGWGVAVFLSGYFIGDDEGNDGLAPDVIIAREHSVTEQFADELEALLGEGYEVAPYCGYNGA